MKKIFAVLMICAVMVFSTAVFAGQATIYNRVSNGTSAMVSLMSGSTGTTSAANTNYGMLDYPFRTVGCDVITYPTSSTGVITVLLYSNSSGTTLFDTVTPAIASSFTITPSLTIPVMKTITKSQNPFRTIMGVVTSPVTTTKIDINCSLTL